MAEIAAWNGKKFTVSPTLIRGFTGLSIRGSSNTEDVTAGSEMYVSRKNSKPTEISMTVELSVFTGCEVQSEALAFVEDARAGATDYFYVGRKKLVTYRLMLTDASISDVAIAPNGKWTHCKVNLTMKQAAGVSSGSGGGSSSSAGGGGGGSTKSNPVQAAGNAVKNSILQGMNSAISTLKTAKEASAQKKVTGAGSRIMMLRD